MAYTATIKPRSVVSRLLARVPVAAVSLAVTSRPSRLFMPLFATDTCSCPTVPAVYGRQWNERQEITRRVTTRT